MHTENDGDHGLGYTSAYSSSSEKTQVSDFYFLSESEKEAENINVKFKSLKSLVGDDVKSPPESFASVFSLDSSSLKEISSKPTNKSDQSGHDSASELMEKCRSLFNSFEKNKEQQSIAENLSVEEIDKEKSNSIHRILELKRALTDCEVELSELSRKRSKFDIPANTPNEYLTKCATENGVIREHYQCAKRELEIAEQDSFVVCEAEREHIDQCKRLYKIITNSRDQILQESKVNTPHILDQTEELKLKMFQFIATTYKIREQEGNIVSLLKTLIEDAVQKIMETDDLEQYVPTGWLPFNPSLFSTSSGNGRVLRDLSSSLVVSIGPKGIRLTDPFPLKESLDGFE